MKNIFKIFKTDVRRIATNVIAVIIIIGVSVIPCLYAWFNILSNWDPYGPDATGNLKIAVVSEDKGKEILEVPLNIGDKLIDGLHANNDVGWTFPESTDDALEGVRSGEYYAAFIIPENFSENMMSFLGEEPVSPEIAFYANAKKNAIATKITSKVKTAIQRKINETFVQTITLYSSEAAETVLGNEDLTEKISQTLNGRLLSLETSLDTFIAAIDTALLLNDSAEGLIRTTDAIVPEMGNIINSGKDSVHVMQSGTKAGNSTAGAIVKMGNSALDRLSSNIDVLYAQAGLISSGVDVSTITGTVDTILNGEVLKAVRELIEVIGGKPVPFEVDKETQIKAGAEIPGTGDPEGPGESGTDITAEIDTGISVAGEVQIQLPTAYHNALDAYDRLVAKLQQIESDAADAKNDADSLSGSLQGKVSDAKATLETLRSNFSNNLAPKLTGVVDKASAALNEAGTILGKVDTNFTDFTGTLDSYEKTLAEGTASLNDTRAYVVQMKTDLEKLRNRIAGLDSSEAYNEFRNLMDDDAISLADFVSSPVMLDEKVLYEIPNFGSQMAPFYTILSIWAGSLFLIALLKVKVIEDEENRGMKAWQKFFGRYLIFFVIGQIQALLICLGDLFFLRIYCVSPWLFILTGMIASFVFTMLMYSLTVAFRAIGQAIVVVILVIQVAGSGGTFPIEMLPWAYQAVYRFLPFNYGINAMRECVGGMYGNDYLTDIKILLMFAAIGLVIGLVMMKPFAKLRAAVDRSKENSGIML
ncbi:MAG: YhgE/Pip domain-containing protein [Eubacterium sp.]|nr:YhgE/Pip domain-containing protein [Eubacterium sp.]